MIVQRHIGIGSDFLHEDLLEQTMIRRQFMAQAPSGVEYAFSSYSTGNAIKYLPFGITIFLLRPFPWEARNLIQIFTVPETLFWYVLLFYCFFRGLKAVKFSKYHSVVLSYLIILTIGYAMVAGNMGTSYRYRSQVLPFYLIFIAKGLTSRKKRTHEHSRMEAATQEKGKLDDRGYNLD